MVTGGGANIGREISLAFAKKGAAVVVCDYNGENARRTAAEIEAMGGKAMAAVCDVRDREKIFGFVREAEERFGPVEVLVNNAGGSAGLLGKLTRFVDAAPETLDFVIDTNLKGAMHCAQAVLPSMIENRYGKIINMSSIAAVVGLLDRVDYSAAKAALKRLTLGAMLAAMSVVIGMFCKSFLNFGEGLWRVTFENLPIILAGIFLGPITGGMVGVVSDLTSYLLSPQIYPPNLIVTFGACMVGITSGLMARFAVRQRGSKQIVLSAAVAHVIGSMIIKPIGLFQFYQWAVLVRIPLYLVIAPLEILLLCLLWRQKSFRKLFEKM